MPHIFYRLMRIRLWDIKVVEYMRYYILCNSKFFLLRFEITY